MTKLLPAVALSAALMSSGCSTLQKGVDFLNQPDTRQAVATLKTVATALVCNVSSGSALALAVEKQIANTAGAQATTGIVYTTSSLVCGKLSGQVVGSAANVVAVSAVAQ